MSMRRDVKTALAAAITALSPGATVEQFTGEEVTFQENLIWPAIFVAYAGVEFGENLEIGESTYIRDPHFFVYVATKNGATQGDDQAMDILEAIEEGLSGQEIASYGLAEIADNEVLVGAHMGRFLYRQLWRVPGLESH